MKGVLILFVTAIVVCVGNRTQGVHRHRHAKPGQKPKRDTGSITLKPGTAKNKLFPGYGTNFRYIGEVRNSLLELGMTLLRLEREEALVAYWLMLFQD